MQVTLFWRELRADIPPATMSEYEREDARLEKVAASMPGFVSAKSYTADDGDRVTIVIFESAETQEGWRRLPDHVTAQRWGREEIYERYRSLVLESVRDRNWSRTADRPERSNSGH
jgi:heme-degrading monooxygenase HmoA